MQGVLLSTFRKETGMPAIVSHGLKESPRLQVVPVIASFDSDGNVKPLYVRIGEESLKVFSAIVKSSTAEIMTFRCQVVDGDTLKPLELSYHSRESLWAIPRFL